MRYSSHSLKVISKSLLISAPPCRPPLSPPPSLPHAHYWSVFSLSSEVPDFQSCCQKQKGEDEQFHHQTINPSIHQLLATVSVTLDSTIPSANPKLKTSQRNSIQFTARFVSWFRFHIVLISFSILI